MGLRYLLFLGSVREGRFGERVAKYVQSCISSQGHEVDIVDPLALDGCAMVHQPLHFRKDPSTAPSWMTEINEKIKLSDGIIVVTAEYNSTLPPALTASMDQFPPASYRHKPAAIVCYSMGSFGGIRAAAFARPFLSELGLVPIPAATIIPQVASKFSTDGECSDERAQKSTNNLLAELQWYGEAIKRKIQESGLPVKS